MPIKAIIKGWNDKSDWNKNFMQMHVGEGLICWLSNSENSKMKKKKTSCYQTTDWEVQECQRGICKRNSHENYSLKQQWDRITDLLEARIMKTG